MEPESESECETEPDSDSDSGDDDDDVYRCRKAKEAREGQAAGAVVA